MSRLQTRLLAALTALGVAAACSSAGGRTVTTKNGVPYGAVCAKDADCGGAPDSCCTGGKCGASGWCSPKCSTDRDCPSGFFCISDSGNRCFLSCSDDRDCADGFVCESKDNHFVCRAKG